MAAETAAPTPEPSPFPVVVSFIKINQEARKAARKNA
jgi:hypothetical protein